MRPATMISLGASTALGLAALIVAKIMIPSHAASAQSVAPQAATEGVPVVVAAQPIPYGVKLEPKYLAVVKLPPAAAPAGAFSSVSQILNQQDGPPTAIVPMQMQEAVLPTKLTGVGERATLAALISPNMRAYTIAINEVTGTGGHVMPGDRVDVVLTRDVSADKGANLGGQRQLRSSIAAQNLRVLGVDQNANPTTATPVIARSATLEVSIDDAERLALAAQAGSLSLALRKTGATDVEPVRPLAVADLGGGGPQILRGAEGGAEHHPIHAHRVAIKASDAGGSIMVVNGGVAAKAKGPSTGGAVAFP